jgi:hypothetical protein
MQRLKKISKWVSHHPAAGQNPYSQLWGMNKGERRGYRLVGVSPYCKGVTSNGGKTDL